MMRKIFLLIAAVVTALSVSAASYGILVNGKTYFAGAAAGEFEGYTQYLAHVQVKSGDYLQLYDYDNKAAWAVTLNSYSEAGFTLNDNKYDVTVDGCYDFYIKLKYGADELYIGPGMDCGTGTDISGQGGGEQGGGTEAGAYWYWKGYVDGQDINNEVDGGIFDCGLSEIEVTQDGYIFVVYQVPGVPGVQFMASSYVDGPTHATMTTSGSEKLHVPAGNHTLYLYDNGDGTVELAFVEMEGKILVGCTQDITNTAVSEKARKTIIDGQLIIIRGEKMFDVTGRQL